MINVVIYNDNDPVFRIEIEKTKEIRNLGFGHEISEYNVKYYQRNFPIFIDQGEPEEFLEKEDIIVEFDRRDGTLELVKTAIETLGDV